MRQHDSIRTSRGLHKLQLLRSFDGPISQFWVIFLDSISDLVGAVAGTIVSKEDTSVTLRTLAMYPHGSEKNTANTDFLRLVPDAVKNCKDGQVSVFSSGESSVLAVPLASAKPLYAILKLQTVDQTELQVASTALYAVSDIPAHYLHQREAVQIIQQRERLLGVLDVNVLLNTHTRFLSAAMALCNELASAYSCTRVSLGWKKGHYFRLKAMSQTDHFEKKMEIVQRLEAAMEEAADQDSEILFPLSDDSNFYCRAHEQYQKLSESRALLTMPVRHNGEIVGVVLFEKSEGGFADSDIHHTRMVLDQVSARLTDLQHKDKWMGARFVAWSRVKLAKVFGFEHTWVKLALLLVTAIALVAVSIPLRYRVDSPMILKTDDITFLAAPFDGYIASVASKAGENVKKKQIMLSLDTKDLILEESGILAEGTKAKREEDKSRAESKLAEMRIAQSQIDQLSSRHSVVQLRLSQADVKAPFDGIIIEGDLHERVGSPVKQGEILFKLGRIEDIKVEVKVKEGEIQNIVVGANGQIALASRPNEPFDVVVDRIEPSSTTDATGNVFVVICSFKKAVPQWFRPGMTGVAKIESGKKTLFWIISHQTIDFIRLKLWW